MKRYSPGFEQQRAELEAVLGRFLVDEVVLEIGAGSGQHAAHLARALPSVTWIPSDSDEAQLDSIAEWRREAGLPNLRPPLLLDVRDEDWEIPPIGAMVVVDPPAAWPLVVAILNGAQKYLPPRGRLFVLGELNEEALRVAATRGLEIAEKVGKITVLRRI